MVRNAARLAGRPKNMYAGVMSVVLPESVCSISNFLMSRMYEQQGADQRL